MVTITGGAEQSEYPEARLYDWAASLYWKRSTIEYEIGGMGGDEYVIGGMGGDEYEIGGAGAGDLVIEIDQEDDVKDVTTLFIVNHNFDGGTIQFEYSDDGSAWSDAVTSWTQDGAGYIAKTLTSQSSRYWKLTIADVDDPQAGEILIGSGDSFGILKSPAPQHNYLDNVVWSQSIGGAERSIKQGDERRSRAYAVALSSADLSTFQTLLGRLNGFSKPFLFKDKDDVYFLGRFEPPPGESYFNNNRTLIDVNVIEML